MSLYYLNHGNPYRCEAILCWYCILLWVNSLKMPKSVKIVPALLYDGVVQWLSS